MNWRSLEQLVPSFDLCQQLKAAGFPQGTALSYYKNPRDTFGIVMNTMAVGPYCAAPTAEEILEELPLFVDEERYEQLSVTKQDSFPDGDDRNGYIVDWWNTQVHGRLGGVGNKSLACRAAQAYLWWKGQK